MIELVTGKSGSGKSYKVVADIVELLTTRKVITNIKIDMVHPNYIYKTEHELKEYILMISNLFDDVRNLPQLISDLSKEEFFDVSFYIDECHLVGFRKRHEGLINWLSVRRHLNQNIVLITQTLKKIHSDYSPDIHLHTEMVAQNKRANKNMIGWKTYDEVGGDRIATKYVSPNKELFEIYKSGKNEAVTNMASVKLVAWAVALIGLLVLLYFLFSSGLKQVNSSDGILSPKILNPDTNKTSSDENETLPLTEVKCDFYMSKPRDYTLAVREKNGWHVCLVEKVL